MTNEVKAALQRRRSGDYSDIKSINQRSLQPRVDADLLANAYLAEHPEDDGEPVTHQWLRNVGFTRGMQAASTEVLSLWSEKNHISIDMDDSYIRVAIGDSDVSEYLPAGFSMQTRGDVRRLCAALGIELKGKE